MPPPTSSRLPPIPSTCPICGGPATDEADPDRAWYTTCMACRRVFVTHWGRRSPSIELPLEEDRAWAAEHGR